MENWKLRRKEGFSFTKYVLFFVIAFLFFCFCSKSQLKMRDSTFIDIYNKRFSLNPENTNILFYTDNVIRDYSTLLYLNIISLKFKSNNLCAIAVFRTFDESELKTINEINLQSVKYTKISSIPSCFKKVIAKSNSNKLLILLNKDFSVGSEYKFFKEDDIRQLVEKRLFNKINPFNRDLQKRINVGELLFNDAKLICDGNLLPSATSSLWFVITSNCMNCVLNSNLLVFKSIEDALFKKSTLIPKLLFSRFFNENIIKETVMKLKIKTPVFIANKTLQGIEDDYFKKTYDDFDILVVETDKKNMIISIIDFNDFIYRFQEGKFNE